MTSPRQRKKRLALKKLKEKREQQAVSDHKPLVVEKQVQEQKVESSKPVAAPPQSVVESAVDPKPKKPKQTVAETKSQVQVVEQPKQEVKSEIKE